MMLKWLCGLECLEERHRDLGSLGKVKQCFFKKLKGQGTSGEILENFLCRGLHPIFLQQC